MKTLLAALVIALIQCSVASLVITGPPEPVSTSEPATVECFVQDTDHNISSVQFEYTSKHMEGWARVEEGFFWCGYGRKRVMRAEDRVTLIIPWPSSRESYRCVIDGTNGTATEPLNFTTYSLSEPQLTKDGFSRYLGFPNPLVVESGAYVEVDCSAHSTPRKPDISWSKSGSDWILPSAVLVLERASAFDEGQYTCLVRHPTVSSVYRTRTFNLTVLPERHPPWHLTSEYQTILMALSAAVACLLLLTLALSVYFCPRVKKSASSAGIIDDHSQKKPIYKSESVPSSCGDDKQPLV